MRQPRIAPARGYTLPPHWPYDVRRVPLFYGWVIWLLSALGYLVSVPGQTMGMAVFTDPFMAAFGLGRTELSTACFFGTLASSLFLTRAGRWYDRHQARTMMVAASLVLGVVLVFISSRRRRLRGSRPPVAGSARVLPAPGRGGHRGESGRQRGRRPHAAQGLPHGHAGGGLWGVLSNRGAMWLCLGLNLMLLAVSAMIRHPEAFRRRT